MKKKSIVAQIESTAVCCETLESFARLEIQRWSRNLLEAEVTEFLGRGRHERTGGSGYRNGYGKPRRLALTAGTVTVKRPRVRDVAEAFESKVLPLFKRQSKEVGGMLPELSLHGLSAWGAIRRDLKARGLKLPARLVADGHLGIRGALAEQAPSTAEQRCWNHQIVNVLDHFAKKDQAEAAAMLKKMMYAPTRSHCERHRRVFALRYRKTHPKACATLERDWERMVTYYGFPKAHWIHLRTTNIVESPFNSVRLRTEASRRFKKVENDEAMVWKLLTVAEKSWRKLNAPNLLKAVYDGNRSKVELP